EIDNPLGWGDLDYDFQSDSVFVASQLSIEESGFRRTFDGTFRVGATDDDRDMDLTTELIGVAVRSDIYMDCDRSGCDLGASGVELVGIGGARVSGSIGVNGTQTSGSLTLKGADTVKVTIASNCVSW